MVSRLPGPRLPRANRPRRRCFRFRLVSIPYIAFALILFIWLVMPHDSIVRLLLRFHLKNIQSSMKGRPSEDWVFAPPAFLPVNLAEDTLVVVKTGYGTRERVPAFFDALPSTSEFRDFLVIADYSSLPGKNPVYRGEEMPIHDMVNHTLSHADLFTDLTTDPRAIKYRALTDAIADSDWNLALKLSESSGWELDAMKFISGLQFAYEKFPSKKWYIMADDDTYFVQPSLKPLLAHLDPKLPYYLGNAVGDFKGRFAHGGSAIILSQAAMRALLFKNPKIVSAAHMDALTETWGDRLLAKALIKAGVYLEETYSHLFNGESPEETKIRPDRFCSPIITFHTLNTPEKMASAGKHFAEVTKAVLWNDLLELYDAHSPWRHDTKGLEAANKNWDHIGTPDDTVTTIDNVVIVEDCINRCENYQLCMGWTWESQTLKCRISPYVTVGKEAKGMLSGMHTGRMRHLDYKCPHGILV
ncbi:hypothetical protein B0T19DRAFT_186115 [Cercophora scortea]|uniref:N-acetylgalactosaminide beta-1,3-galactosyltransferase n=1 Tax=Cercophora scortea TaxID=314031 RepID=A0AAE0ING3_9PEZI|nr:hypothetical protein B0T19DRAFT_186115 [Cercophora scortea]